MTYVAPNSVQARDIASLVHPQTNLAHAPRGRPGGDRARRGHLCLGRQRRAVPGRGGGPVVRVARLRVTSGWRRVAYEQMRKLGYYHLYRGTTNEPGVDLAEKLLQIAPVPMSKVLFQCSGSEANDTAIKLVWYYHAAIGKPDKRKIIGRHDGLSRQHLGLDQRVGQARHACRFRPAVPRFPAHRISRITTASTRRARPRSSSPRAWPTRWSS